MTRVFPPVVLETEPGAQTCSCDNKRFSKKHSGKTIYFKWNVMDMHYMNIKEPVCEILILQNNSATCTHSLLNVSTGNKK